LVLSISMLFIPEIHKEFSINNKKISDSEMLSQEASSFINTGEEYEQEIGHFLINWLNQKDHIVVKTSGSTGVPKDVKVLKKHMVNSAKATGEFFMIEEATSVLLCLSANYIAGKMMLVRAMTLGWNIDLVSPRTNPLDGVNKQYDFCAMVPLQLDNSVNRLHLIKKLIVGGGPVSKNLKERVQGLETKIFETYGMTETVSHIAARRVNPNKTDTTSAVYFNVLPNIEVSTDQRNCLVIHAPQLTNETIITNDVVEVKTNKKFVWKGRYDTIINSGGIKLFPEEIENKLQLLIDNRFIIAGIPDDVLGDRLILIIEQEEDRFAKMSLKQELNTNKYLSKYEIPKEIYYIPQFIETSTGKIQRKKTLELIS